MLDNDTLARLLERVQNRLSGDAIETDEALLSEYIQTAADRINLRIGADGLPEVMESIAVDVVVKMVRRQYYEGISSETTEFSTSFFENILSEYEEEFEQYLSSHNPKLVRFI